MSLPDAPTLGRAARAATAAAERDTANAALHHAVAVLLNQWAVASPYLHLGGLYPGIGALGDLTRAYLGPL